MVLSGGCRTGGESKGAGGGRWTLNLGSFEGSGPSKGGRLLRITRWCGGPQPLSGSLLGSCGRAGLWCGGGHNRCRGRATELRGAGAWWAGGTTAVCASLLLPGIAGSRAWWAGGPQPHVAVRLLREFAGSRAGRRGLTTAVAVSFCYGSGTFCSRRSALALVGGGRRSDAGEVVLPRLESARRLRRGGGGDGSFVLAVATRAWCRGATRASRSNFSIFWASLVSGLEALAMSPWSGVSNWPVRDQAHRRLQGVCCLDDGARGGGGFFVIAFGRGRSWPRG